MRTYLYVLAAFLLIALVLGFGGPALFRSRHTDLVLFALLLVAFLPIPINYLWRRWLATDEGKKIRERLRSTGRFAPIALLALMLGACSNVPPGYVGVVVNKYGSEQGVAEKEIGVGSHWLSWNETLFTFPTFVQTDTWMKTSSKDESISFQTGKDGMELNADFGVTFRVDPSRVTTLFQTYRRGMDEISDVYIRNLVRDAINDQAADYSSDDAYGRRKNEMMDAVEKLVRDAIAPRGIIIEKVYLVGAIRLPPQVRAAVDEKNKSFQATLQRQQEIEKSKAEAEIKVALARGDAEAILTRAKAEAEGNLLVSRSITPELVRYRALDKWDGVMPRMTGGAMPFIDVTAETLSRNQPKPAPTPEQGQ